MENYTNYTIRDVHIFTKNGITFLVDSDSLNIYEIDERIKKAINHFQKKEYMDIDSKVIDELIERKIILLKEEYIEEKEKNILELDEGARNITHFNKLVLGVSNMCNMSCDYCYGDGGNYGLACAVMSKKTAKHSIDYLIQNSGNHQTLHICFFGGEPLCNFEVIKYVVDYCNSLNTNKSFQYSITTNGTLFNEEIISFFKRNNFAVLLSLDGPKMVHDRYRKLNNGKGTYELVQSNFVKLRQNKIHVSTRATICSKYINVDEIYKHAYNLGAVNAYASLVSINKENVLYIDKAKKLEILRRYEMMAEELYENVIAGNYHFKSPLKSYLAKIYYKNRKAIPCGAGTRIRAINYQGNVYPCQRFMGDQINILDNVIKCSSIENEQSFQMYNVLKHPVCGKCWLKYLCSGGCHHSNIIGGQDLYSCSKESCELLQGIFEIIIYIYWRLKCNSNMALNDFFENIKNN